MTANWKVANDVRWTVPVGGGGVRVFKIGRQPVNLNTQFFYNAIRPPGFGGFTWRLSLAFFYPVLLLPKLPQGDKIDESNLSGVG